MKTETTPLDRKIRYGYCNSKSKINTAQVKMIKFKEMKTAVQNILADAWEEQFGNGDMQDYCEGIQFVKDLILKYVGKSFVETSNQSPRSDSGLTQSRVHLSSNEGSNPSEDNNQETSNEVKQ